MSVHRDGDLGLCRSRGMAVCLHTHLPLPLCSKENSTINLISQQFVASYQKRYKTMKGIFNSILVCNRVPLPFQSMITPLTCVGHAVPLHLHAFSDGVRAPGVQWHTGHNSGGDIVPTPIHVPEGLCPTAHQGVGSDKQLVQPTDLQTDLLRLNAKLKLKAKQCQMSITQLVLEVVPNFLNFNII